MLGARSYEYIVAPTGQITVRLFDSKEQEIALVEVNENLTERSMVLRYKDKNTEDWISTSMSKSTDSVIYSVKSSAGVELLVKARMEDSRKSEKLRVSSLILETETGLKEFRLDGLDPTESRLAAQQELLTQEGKLFNTPGLLKVKEFIQNFGRLSDNTLQKWSGQSETRNCNPIISTNIIEGPDQCSGYAICTRTATAIPVFICNGGSTCTGVYIIYDYMFRIISTASCAYLNGCA